MVDDSSPDLVVSIIRAFVWIYPGYEHSKLY
jgi:hypothetical protein